MMSELALVGAAVTVLSSGCAAPRPDYSVKAADPTEIIPAIKIAVERHDLSVCPTLVKDLENDDPAIRFYADDGLKKLTGQDFGYLYYAEPPVRKPAEEKWAKWLASHDQVGASSHGPDATQEGR